MKAGNSDSGLVNSFGQAKKKKLGAPVLAWIPRASIIRNVEDNKGTTIDLILKESVQFCVVDTIGTIKVSSVKKGLSKVEHEVTFRANEEDRLKILESSQDKPICFLLRTQEGNFEFLGEENGLSIYEKEDDDLHFKGTESDVFYKVTEECFYKLLPNIEK